MQDSEMQNIWRWKWRRRRRRRRRGKVLAGSRWRSAEKNTSLSEIEPLGIMIILLDIFRFFLRFRLKRQMEKIHLCRSVISMRTVKLLFLSRRCRRSSRFFELLTFGIRKVRSFQTQFHLQIASDFSYLWRRLLIRADMSGEEERKWFAFTFTSLLHLWSRIFCRAEKISFCEKKKIENWWKWRKSVFELKTFLI